MLVLENISCINARRSILSNVNLSVSRGEIVGLLGINGAGKSTTLKIAAGILLPDSGQVKYESHLRLGYVPETPPLLDNWLVGQFLNHVADLYGLSQSDKRHAIEYVISLCDLSAVLKQPCYALSKGNQQRLAIAQALLNKPTLLILDEPTSGLDPKQIVQFRDMLTSIQRDTAIIFSSHIMQEITSLCDRAYIIHQGKPIGTLPLKDDLHTMEIVFDNPVNCEVFASCEAWQSGEGCHHRFIKDGAMNANQILQFCLDKQLAIARVGDAKDFAEQTFLSLIGQSTQSTRGND